MRRTWCQICAMNEQASLLELPDAISHEGVRVDHDSSPYTRLDRHSRSIRLLKILSGQYTDPVSFRSSSHELNAAPNYVALSYT